MALEAQLALEALLEPPPEPLEPALLEPPLARICRLEAPPLEPPPLKPRCVSTTHVLCQPLGGAYLLCSSPLPHCSSTLQDLSNVSRRGLALGLPLDCRWQALYWRIVAAEALAAETLHSDPILDSTSDKRATTGCW